MQKQNVPLIFSGDIGRLTVGDPSQPGNYIISLSRQDIFLNISAASLASSRLSYNEDIGSGNFHTGAAGISTGNSQPF